MYIYVLYLAQHLSMGGHTSSWVPDGIDTNLFTKLEHDTQQQWQECLTNYASLVEEITLIHEKGPRI